MALVPGACISTNPSTHASVAAPRVTTPVSVSSAKLYRRLYKAATRRKTIRVALLVSNVAILVAVAAFVLHDPKTDSTAKVSALSVSTGSLPANPLDQLSSADIALTVARMSSLPESTAITNQAQSQAVTLAAAAASDTLTTKPQVVATTLKSSADIINYTVTAGDTVPSLAAKFGVTSDSIRWSNNLTGDALTPGAKLSIPPVNGIVYTVAAGDTVDSLAGKFNANKDKIVAFNDAEIKGLVPGTTVVIPDGTKAVALTAAQIVSSSASASNATSFPWGSSPVYGSNGYDYGYCTWYVANKIAVPSNWGNANTWDNLAPSSGWTVSSVPRAGAVAQTDRGYDGHVAYVEAVSDDGTMIKYSDMNGLAGFGRVGYSDWVSASHFAHYIYR